MPSVILTGARMSQKNPKNTICKFIYKTLTLILQTTVSLTENSFKHFIPHKMKLSEGVKMNLS